MTRREAVLSALLVFVVAIVARIIAASVVVFPQPEDTAYYVGVARNLVEGRGLVADAIWSYQTPPLSFPRPAFEVWLPLPSFLAAIPMAVFGPTFRSAQVASILVGAVVPVLAWRLGADVAAELGLSRGRARTMALGAGLTSAVYLPLVLHSSLPDSTMPYAALAVGACLLMPRIARDPARPRPGDPRLIALGILIGLAALTRNEAVWIGVAWAIVAWRIRGMAARQRLVLIGVPAAVAALVFAPWAVRDWQAFGNPLPGQALANALSVTGFDIFAWNDPPTLARYLAAGPSRLLEMRAEGISHNLFSVLLVPGVPLAFVGLLALSWTGRLRALRGLVLLSLITFFVTSLLFPVATTWGTFLHAAGPTHVLLVVSALVALDAAIARIGRFRGWTRPVAWLGPALTIFGSILFSVALLPGFGGQSAVVGSRYVALQDRLAAVGFPLDRVGPVITDFPIWLAEATPARSLALPAESPTDVLDLAAHFPGTRLLIVSGSGHGAWPGVLDTTGPGVDCFREIHLGRPTEPGLAGILDDTRVFELICP